MRLHILTTSCKMYCIPCFRRIQCSHSLPQLTKIHLYAGFHLNGKTIPNCYVVTISCMVTHKEGGQGGHCGHYMARYCHVSIFRFCWCVESAVLSAPSAPLLFKTSVWKSGPVRSTIIRDRQKNRTGPQKTAVCGLLRSFDWSSVLIGLHRFKTGFYYIY